MPKHRPAYSAHAWSQLETASQSDLFEDVWPPELTSTN